MRRIVANIGLMIALAVGLSACDVIGKLTNGLKHVQATQADLEKATGMKPDVSFKWANGRLVLVTVTFPHPYENKPMDVFTEEVRAIVIKDFGETPEKLVLGFSSGTARGNKTPDSKVPDGKPDKPRSEGI